MRFNIGMLRFHDKLSILEKLHSHKSLGTAALFVLFLVSKIRSQSKHILKQQYNTLNISFHLRLNNNNNA